MTLDKADKIVQIWGKYLEYCSKLLMVFGSRIPESFLPFPKGDLEKAIGVVVQHYRDTNNHKAAEVLQNTVAHLISYIDDEEALSQAAQLLNESEWRKAIVPVLKKFQKDWVKTQGF